LHAILSSDRNTNLGKISIFIISTLLITVAISAIVGASSAKIFNITVLSDTMGENEIARGQYLEDTLNSYNSTTVQDQLLNIIPTNIFYAFTGQGNSTTLSIVFIGVLFGLALYKLRENNEKSVYTIINLISIIRDIIMYIVDIILNITPYAIFSLIVRVFSTNTLFEILKLAKFILASYSAIILMFIIHLLILSVFNLKATHYLKKSMPALIFAFSSRTSAGTLPITTKILRDKMGVQEGIANLAASIGTTVGQNGCAGIYPAMLAVIIAPVVGIDPFNIVFLSKVILITTISSIGIAGVGGGATFAALAVLSGLGLPVSYVGVLISIEPLIDMARTALNVSGSMVSGLITAKILKSININVYKS
jgi:L-cystine uptake protein TcyP (sodium:dicarboxylate symporter family)